MVNISMSNDFVILRVQLFTNDIMINYLVKQEFFMRSLQSPN
jgi:hypothetical protein